MSLSSMRWGQGLAIRNVWRVLTRPRITTAFFHNSKRLECVRRTLSPWTTVVVALVPINPTSKTKYSEVSTHNLLNTARRSVLAPSAVFLPRCGYFPLRHFHGSGSRHGKKDYYDVLGLKKDSSQSDIKKSYYKLAKEYHPDRNKGKAAAEKFAEISEAYEVLGSEDSRRRYDDEGHAQPEYQNYRQAHPNFDPRSVFRNFEDIFGGAGFNGGGFNGGGFDVVETNAKNKTYGVNLSFMEAALGCVKRLNLNRRAPCSTCHGSGSKPGHQPVLCTACGGQGQRKVNAMFGEFMGTCQVCNGAGKQISNPCHTCNGNGWQQRIDEIEVKFPEGINTNNNLTLHGKGDMIGPGTTPGDAVLKIQVEPSPYFERQGTNVITKHAISIAEAALGAEVNIKLVKGGVLLKIPAGTQPGTKLRLSGKGIKKMNSHEKGDHLVEVVVSVPRFLNAKQKDIMLKLQKALSEKSG